MIAAAALALALAGAPDDPGYRFARALALAGPRPAGSASERRAHAQVEARPFTGARDHLGALAAARRVRRLGRAGSGLSVRWIRDSATGNSDHREFELAGLPAAKLGVPDDPCRHTACDRAARLQASTFPRVRRLVERLLVSA